MSAATWETDAKLFGILEAGNEKAYRALLCARSVELSRSGVSVKSDTSPKVSAARFAKVAGISVNTVKTYVKTWDAMAKDEVVPARADLAPGVDVELPDKAVWTKYYRQATAPKAPVSQSASASTAEATVSTLETPRLTVPQVSPESSDQAAKVAELVRLLSEVTPTKATCAKYDQALALAGELASEVGARELQVAS